MSPNNIIIEIMFGRVMRRMSKLLPLAAVFAPALYTQTYRLDSPDSTSSARVTEVKPIFPVYVSPHPKIKIIKDIHEYLESDPDAGVCVIIYELKGDPHLDQQVIDIAEEFIRKHSSELSHDFQFLLMQSNPEHPPQEDNYMVVYGVGGEKLISIDPYLSRSASSQGAKINRKSLMSRLVEGVNLYREVGLQTINEQLKSMASSDHYAALVAIGIDDKTDSSRMSLKKFLKTNEVINKRTRKFVLKDQQSKTILGLSGRKEGVYLIVSQSSNLKDSYRSKADYISINGRNFAVIDPKECNLRQKFVFPPVGIKVAASEPVVNCYVNRNAMTADIEASLYQQMSKEAYKDYQRSLFYSNDVKQGEIVVEKQDYTQIALEAYQKPPKISKEEAKKLLRSSYQYRYPLTSEQPLNSEDLQQWIKDSVSGVNPHQSFKSEAIQGIYAQQLTGQEYKEVLQSPRDKIIYHYSQHCHGCKKFGGKYQLFARDAHLILGLDFYRIDNDRNKAEGVRNYNSTPVFAFYKKGYPQYPFLYRMDIWTESLFRMFLAVTKDVGVVEPSVLQKNVRDHIAAGNIWRELQTA